MGATRAEQRKARHPRGGAQELIARLRQQVGRLEIAPEELEGRNQRSAGYLLPSAEREGGFGHEP